jgi:hypothetical protein
MCQLNIRDAISVIKSAPGLLPLTGCSALSSGSWDTTPTRPGFAPPRAGGARPHALRVTPRVSWKAIRGKLASSEDLERGGHSLKMEADCLSAVTNHVPSSVWVDPG